MSPQLQEMIARRVAIENAVCAKRNGMDSYIGGRRLMLLISETLIACGQSFHVRGPIGSQEIVCQPGAVSKALALLEDAAGIDAAGMKRLREQYSRRAHVA